MSNKLDLKKFDLENYVGEFAERDSRKSRDGDAWFKCPFHKESTASFHVSGKQIFHCHGCGASGGIIDFVKQANDISTKEALNIISEKSDQEIVAVEVVYDPVLFQVPQEYEKIYSYNGGFVLKYRLKDKGFTWCHFKDGEWWLGRGDVEVKLYAPKGIDGIVVLAEGEKDADVLCEMGFNGVSSPNGTYKWKDEYTEELKVSDKVVLLNDNDFQGISGSQLCQRYLKDGGILAKRISPLEIENNDVKGFDIYDVVGIIGLEETKSRLQALINDDGGWGVLWNEVDEDTETETETEEVEVEIVFESGMGEEYDELVLRATQETLQNGDVNELTLSEITKYAKKSGVGVKRIKDRIKELVTEQTPKEVYKETKSKVMKLDELGVELDIRGSGYTIQEHTGAIYDSNGDEVIGHFLSFIGVVVDAHSDQDNSVKMCLAYNTPQDLSNIRTLIVPKNQMAMSTDMVKLLSGYNINVTQVNGGQVIQYLQDLQNHFNVNTKTMRSISKFGWLNDRLMPYEQQEAQVIFDPKNVEPTSKKLLDKKGDREISRLLIKEVAQYSESSALLLGATVGSLIMSYIDDGGNQSFAFNVWNETSTGKTVSSQVATSLLGYPIASDGWWAASNATVNTDMNHNALMGNLPTFIDDPALNRHYTSDQKRDYIYTATSGQGRGRMQRDGETAKSVSEWCNIIIMTNETAFIDDSIANGGARSRCIEVMFDKPLTKEVATRWMETVTVNYGHFGLEIAQKIREVGKVSLNEALKNNIKWFNSKGVDGKQSTNASFLVMGLQLLNDMLELDSINVKEWLAKQLRGSGSLSDGERSFAKLMKRVEVSEGVYRSMFDRDNVFIGSFGYSSNGTKVLNLPYKTLEKYGKEDGYNQDGLITWGYNNDKMIPQFDKNGRPKSVVITDGTNRIKVVQVVYEWNGNARYGDNDYPLFETEEEIIDV